MQRHPNDTATPPWEGAADIGDLRYCPPELRAIAAAIPPDLERKFLRECYDTPEMVVTTSVGGHSRVPRTLNPDTNDSDFQAALARKKIAWARMQFDAEQRNTETADNFHKIYDCPCCGEYAPATGDGKRSATQPRNLPDGTRVTVCLKCATIMEALVVERLAGEQINGKTRRDRAAAMLNGATP